MFNEFLKKFYFVDSFAANFATRAGRCESPIEIHITEAYNLFCTVII